jgi:hypothetical protein
MLGGTGETGQDLYVRAAPFAATATKTIKRRRVS